MTKKLLISLCFALLTVLVLASNVNSQTYFSEGFEGDTVGAFKNVAGNTGTTAKWAKITTHHAFGNSSARFDTTQLADLQVGLLELKNGKYCNVNISNIFILADVLN